MPGHNIKRPTSSNTSLRMVTAEVHTGLRQSELRK
jgi:hypothetical protein